MSPPLFKYDASHRLVDKAVVVMLAISYKSCMAAERRHLLKIGIHIVSFGKQFVAEQAVDGKNGGSCWKIMADLLDGVSGDRLIVAQF